ncbi:hypothetical protein CDD82_1931 [Ophiocordyceps australis]|uniref:Uncharacterized protein n=1 Tax=Ophiocordyceps australis TaxID=1399860 RepID=A0A2C5Y600_9HYPO|nr:hypothetical protein CDD82_1931 [Ophiocordyceps australis]
MGLISFLARRNEADRHPEPVLSHDGYRGSIASTSARGLSLASNGSSRQQQDALRGTEAALSQSRLASPVKPFFLGIRHESISSLRDAAHQAYTHPKATRDSMSSFQLRSRRLSRLDTDSRSIAPSVRSLAAYSAAESATSRIGRHVDILDAQGELRPYDFKSRIQAAGTRDYGEDVAERNMGQNAVDVQSPAAQAYYASAAGATTAAPGKRANRASIMSNASSSRQSSGTARRSKQAHGSKRTRRAKSTASQSCTEQAGSQSEDERPGLGAQTSASSLQSASAPHVPRFRPPHLPPVSPKDTSHREPEQRAWRQRRVMEAQQPAAGMDSSDEGSVSDSAPAPSVSSYRDERARKTSRHSALPNWRSPWSHFHRDPFGAGDSRGSVAHSRDASWRSFSSQARAMTGDGGAAGPKASLRQWSISSVTPTTEMSDHSSNPAARPRSTHTANTSVDMSYGAMAAAACGGSPDFNLDDCDLSTDSDADSLMDRGRHAESLLFTDAVFGDLGNNLPGLFDSGPSPSCVKCAAATRPPRASSPPAPRLRQLSAPPQNLWRRRDRLRSLGYEYDTDESDSDANGHGPAVQPKRGRTTTQRPALATMRYRVDSRIDEDDEEQVDVRAQTLRPPGKARSKARLQSRHRARAGIEPVLEDCEGGNVADVE